MYQEIVNKCFKFVIKALVQIILPVTIPCFLFPLTIGFAARNIYCGITISIALILIVHYAEWFCKTYEMQTIYFFTWSLWSVVYLWILFKMTIPIETQRSIEYQIYFWSMFTASVLYCVVSFTLPSGSLHNLFNNFNVSVSRLDI